MNAKFRLILILLPLLLGLACNLRQSSGELPTPTPALEVARFNTATPTSTITPTPLPTDTPTPVPPTETPSPTATITPISSPTTIGARPTAELLPLATLTPTPVESEAVAVAAGPTVPLPTPTPADTPTPEPPPAPGGRIAFPVDDGGGHYDIWAVELDKGEPFFVLDRARQPSFSPTTGQLLVNNEVSPRGENLGLFDSNFSWLGLVSDMPEDEYPTWDPGGGRYAFGNPILLQDPFTQNSLPFIFVTCSLSRPLEESAKKCSDTAGMSKLVPGRFPVWTDDGRIAYAGFTGEQGLYVVSAEEVARQTGGADAKPQFIMAVVDARPSDVSGGRLYFSTTNLDGNWEAYGVNLDGSGLTNLSNSPESQDGLPAASPDGRWVAFVSNRDNEKWGLWIVPSTGGEPEKLADLPAFNPNGSPWGGGDHDWINERITWGP